MSKTEEKGTIETTIPFPLYMVVVEPFSYVLREFRVLSVHLTQESAQLVAEKLAKDLSGNWPVAVFIYKTVAGKPIPDWRLTIPYQDISSFTVLKVMMHGD